jgi:hypothetical protein
MLMFRCGHLDDLHRLHCGDLRARKAYAATNVAQPWTKQGIDTVAAD